MRDAEIKAAPIVGIHAQPLPWLQCGVTYRAKFYAETVGTQDILITFRDFSCRFPRPFRSAVLATIHYIHYWTPNEVAAGFALKPRNDLLIAADLTWSNWSQYLDPQSQVPEKKFRDTYTPRIGLEYIHHTGIVMRAGYSFQPSPVPEQTGSANYLDNDKHVFSIGLGYTFSRSPIPIWKKPLTVDSYFQYQKLVQREYHKESQVPPENDLTFGGYLISAGIDLVLHY
jgi:long-chain fatty acid transport protein